MTSPIRLQNCEKAEEFANYLDSVFTPTNLCSVTDQHIINDLWERLRLPKVTVINESKKSAYTSSLMTLLISAWLRVTSRLYPWFLEIVCNSDGTETRRGCYKNLFISSNEFAAYIFHDFQKTGTRKFSNTYAWQP